MQETINVKYDYKPFGEKLNIKGNDRLSFINKEKDAESSLGDFGVRKYDEEIGRFTSIDPLFEKYYSLTPYQYSANNPVNAKDFNGKDIKYQLEGNANNDDIQLANDAEAYLLNTEGMKDVINEAKNSKEYTLFIVITDQPIMNKNGTLGDASYTPKLLYRTDINETNQFNEKKVYYSGGKMKISNKLNLLNTALKMGEEFFHDKQAKTDPDRYLHYLNGEQNLLEKDKTLEKEVAPQELNLKHELIHQITIE